MKKLTKKQHEMAQLLLEKMENSTIVSPTVQIGILCVLMKESGLEPKREKSYANTSNERIRKIFGRKKLGNYYDSELALDSLKKQPVVFFNFVYRGVAGNGPPESGDGWNYRGGGLGQLTGKGNYKAASHDGVDLVDCPDFIVVPEIAATVSIDRFSKQLKKLKEKELATMPAMYTREELEKAVPAGVLLAAHINAGLGKKIDSKAVQMGYNNAMKYSSVMTDEYVAYWSVRMGAV